MKEVKGDLLKLAMAGEFDVIVHGCNCFTTMGAGIAKQVASKFSVAKIADEATAYGDIEKLGTYSSAVCQNDDGEDFIIVNAYTQHEPGPNCNYAAIQKAFIRIAHDFPDARIGYPMIGAGIARGDWGKISAIIDEELKGLDHTLVIFDPSV